MKNKLLIFLILIKFTFSFQIPLFSDEIKFEAENIETIDENLIIANNNIVVNDNYGNKIYGDKLEIKDKAWFEPYLSMYVQYYFDGYAKHFQLKQYTRERFLSQLLKISFPKFRHTNNLLYISTPFFPKWGTYKSKSS